MLSVEKGIGRSTLPLLDRKWDVVFTPSALRASHVIKNCNKPQQCRFYSLPIQSIPVKPQLCRVSSQPKYEANAKPTVLF